jgi:hypothetical protein
MIGGTIFGEPSVDYHYHVISQPFSIIAIAHPPTTFDHTHSRLRTVENQLSGVNVTALRVESAPTEDEKILTDMELSEILGVSNLILRDYRVKGKKPPAGLAKKLQNWSVKGDRLVRKS